MQKQNDTADMPVSPLTILESQLFPVAYFEPSGRLGFANGPFRILWQGFDLGPLDDLAHMQSLLGFSLGKAGFSEFTSSSGKVVAFASSQVEQGGWTISAMDITEQRRHRREAERAQKVALIALADLAEHRDNDTGEHFQRVARMTYEVARCMKSRQYYRDTLTDDFLTHIGVASILHDVGKVGTSDAILHKQDILSDEERAIMQNHASCGGALLRKAETLMSGSLHFHLAAEIAEYHHERLDGSGYPHGISGNAIPLSARIVAATAVYDALLSERSYKRSWSQDETLDYLQSQAGIGFDPLVIECLVDVVRTRSQANTVVWTPKMSVGVPILDHDHRVLIALVNQISLPENRTDPLAVEFVLDELRGYTALHFNREEDMIAQAGFPDIVRHRNIHRTMINSVSDLQNRVLTAFTPGLGEELHHFLARWLTNHIMVEDMGYVPYLRGQIPGK